MKKFIILFILLCLAILQGPALIWSQEQNPPSITNSENSILTPPNEDPVNPWLYNAEKEPDNFQAKFLNMLFILALLVGFMLLASWMIKRMMRTRLNQVNVTSLVKILETRPLSPRSTIYLLDVNGQGLVIAESQMGVTHLATFPLEKEEDIH